MERGRGGIAGIIESTVTDAGRFALEMLARAAEETEMRVGHT